MSAIPNIRGRGAGGKKVAPCREIGPWVIG
jgi:hypothetical protein